MNPDATVAQITVPTAGDGFDAESARALDALRGEIVPATLGAVDGVEVSVSGPAAQTRDFNESMGAHLPVRVRVRAAGGVRRCCWSPSGRS